MALYLNPAESLAGSLKACLLTINEGASKQQLPNVKPAEEGESDHAKLAEKVEGDRKKLREAVLPEKVTTSKKQLSAWSYEIG